jgi:hypothetical protein
MSCFISLFPLPASVLPFTRSFYFPFLSSPICPLFILSIFGVIPLFYNISFAHAEEDYLEGRKCCGEDILEKRGRALEREEKRRWRERTSNSER